VRLKKSIRHPAILLEQMQEISLKTLTIKSKKLYNRKKKHKNADKY